MAKTLVFISWSGERAKQVAGALSDWLPLILQGADPWCSDATDAGRFWGPEIVDRLNRARIGIIIVTAENREKPWLLFEGGAIAKALPSQADDARAVPYLVGLELKDLQPPLSLLQAMEATPDGTLRLVQSVNRALPEPLPDAQLRRLFDALYPELERTLIEARAMPVAGVPPQKQRDTNEMLAELLSAVHNLSGRIERDRLEEAASRAREALLAEVSRMRQSPSVRFMPPDDDFQDLKERLMEDATPRTALTPPDLVPWSPEERARYEYFRRKKRPRPGPNPSSGE